MRRRGRDWWDEREPQGLLIALVVSLLVWLVLIICAVLVVGSFDG
tara:strand:- start:1519 stop:1653 length:135 start_codon:yes stop_codon:yes gene_type:complete